LRLNPFGREDLPFFVSDADGNFRSSDIDSDQKHG
jgi:hypothetical protein